MSDLSSVQQFRRQARERVRTWGAGARGDMGTPSPMYGAREGGVPQPGITVTNVGGETITVVASTPIAPGGDEIEHQSVATSKTRLGFASLELPAAGLRNAFAGYYQLADLDLSWDDGWDFFETMQVRMDGTTIDTTPPENTTRLQGTIDTGDLDVGRTMTVFVDHGDTETHVLSSRLTYKLVEPRGIGQAVDFPPEFPPGEITAQSCSIAAIGTTSRTLSPPTVELGQMMVAWAATRSSSWSALPSGWTVISDSLLGGRGWVAWRRATAGDVAGTTSYTWASPDSSTGSVSAAIWAMPGGFAADGNPFGTPALVQDTTTGTHFSQLTVEAPSAGDWTLLVGSSFRANFGGNSNKDIAFAAPAVTIGTCSTTSPQRPRGAVGTAVPGADATVLFIGGGVDWVALLAVPVDAS